MSQWLRAHAPLPSEVLSSSSSSHMLAYNHPRDMIPSSNRLANMQAELYINLKRKNQRNLGCGSACL